MADRWKEASGSVKAKKAGLPILVDPKASDFARDRGANTISPDLQELTLVTDDSAAAMESSLNRGQVLDKQLGVPYLTVTLGPMGIAVLYPQSRFHAPAVAKQVFDLSPNASHSKRRGRCVRRSTRWSYHLAGQRRMQGEPSETAQVFPP